MWNARLDESQAGIKIARRNINNLRYADDTTLVAQNRGLKSLLMRGKEDGEKSCLKLKIYGEHMYTHGCTCQCMAKKHYNIVKSPIK